MVDRAYDQLVRQCESIRDALNFAYTNSGEAWSSIDPEDIPAGLEMSEVCDMERGDEEAVIDIMEYIYSALDVEIHGHYDRDAMAWEADYVEVLFTIGGPDVRLSTKHGAVVTGRWGSDRVDRSLDGDIGRYLDEVLTEGLDS